MRFTWQRFRPLLVGLWFVCALWGGTEFPAKPGEPVVANQLLVRYLPGTTLSSINASLVAGAQVQALSASLPGVFLVQLPPGTDPAFSTQLSQHALVDYVEPNRIRGLKISAPNDPHYVAGDQYALQKVNALQAWQLIPNVFLTSATAGTGRIKVAIVDTGADCTHEDFKNGGSSADAASGGQIWFSASQVINAVPGSTANNTTISPAVCPWQDDNGHGTHVSGTVAASTNNGLGVASLGYPLELIEYKVLDHTGSGTDFDVAGGIIAAANAGANVISMSLGSTGYGQTLQNAVNYAWQRNCLVVAAAGNDGPVVESFYPASNNHAIGVGASDNTDTIANFSNRGPQVAVAAPGVGIWSTFPSYTCPTGCLGTNYGSLSGTSMATPHVAALAGLIEMTTPNVAAAAVLQRIQRTADNVQGTANGGWDQAYGYGRINAFNGVSGTLRSATVGGIVGQVVNGSGTPISGATIVATGPSVTTLNTDSVGMYRASNLSAGTYTVTASALNQTTVNVKAAVVAGADTNLTIVMGSTTGEFHGTTKAGATVQAISSGLIQQTAVADNTGAYSVTVSPPGTYDLRASTVGCVTSTVASQNVTANGSVAVNISMPCMGKISGKVTDANNSPISGAQIVVTGTNYSAGAVTDGGGNYSTIPLPAGSYSVTGSASGFPSSTANSVVVNNDAATTVNLILATGVTVTTNPSGLGITVDNVNYTAPHLFSWVPGSGHTIAVSSPQNASSAARLVWASWSDGGAVSHSITAPNSSSFTYTANFTQQYFLTMSASSGGTVNPASNWFNAGQVVGISATPNSGNAFSGWSGSGPGSFTGAASSSSVTMNGAITETASFQAFNGPPALVSVSPSNGSGSAQTFVFTFTESTGAANIVSTQLDIGAALSTSGTCYLYYAQSGNQIYLANDAGSFSPSLSLGSAGTMQNTQCVLDSGASSVMLSGNTLILNLALSFKPAFGGAKNLYMEAQNAAFDSGWAMRGTFTVTNSAPAPDFSLSMTPGSQTVAAGGSTTYTVTATASNGFGGVVSFGVSGLPSGASGSFNPPSVAGSGSSTLTINTTSGTPAGGSTVTVTGTSGSLIHNASASLNVTGSGAPSPPTTVSVSPSSGSGSAQTFAFTFSDSNGGANIVSTQLDVGATLSTSGACYFYYARAANQIYLANDAGSFGPSLSLGSAGTMQNSQCVLDAGASSVMVSGNTLTMNLALSFKPAFGGAKNLYMEAQNASLDSGWAQRGTFTVTNSAPTPDFSLNLSPGSQTVGAGGSTSYTVTATASNGFGGVVSFSVSGLPSGATGSFNPPSVAGSGSSTLTINTTSGTPAGGSTVTVTGTSGSLIHNASASLNVTGSGAPSPPTTVSVSPSSGSGSAQTFAFTFSDSNGGANIVSTQLDVGATLSTSGACYLYYARAANQIYLASDTGSFGPSLALGAAGTMQNSQCVLDAGASSVMVSGNTLTMNLAFSFKPAFGGAKNVYMEAQNSSLDSGWAQRGTFTVNNSAPTPDFSLGMSPGSQTVGAGGSTSYTVTATASNGFSGVVSFGVSGLPSGASGSFNPPSVAGSGSSTLTINTTSGTPAGNSTVTVTGTSGSLVHNASASLNVTGGGAPVPPTTVSVSPSSGSGSAQTFTFTFTDPAGGANIVSTQLDFGATLATSGVCYFYYARAANAIYLASDTGSFGPSASLGSAGTMQNSQCALDAGASSVMVSGNTLTMNLALSFKPAFAGAKNVYMEAQNAAADAGWALRGTWTVP
ncbi:MAG TPA: S8 family serine peptidase [Bryobacteraceae bacterium]|nr:S8 family serine peptidase [Bryobacteraceae bacterium]